MALITGNAPISVGLVGTLPETLPEPPAGASQELIDYHNGLSEWYTTFLIAYNSQQKQLLTKIAAP